MRSAIGIKSVIFAGQYPGYRSNRVPTFFLTAAEHSGDALGASLIRALKKRDPEALFVGVGGEQMAAAGCRLIANPVKRSAMLAGAFLTEARYWWKTLGLIKRELRRNKPQVVIPIDSSAINLRIAQIARGEGIPVCYLVAPQVWASRPGRIRKIKEYVNTLCCIFPFEERYFRDRGVNGVYVGHPMFDVPADSSETDPARLDPPLPAGSPRIALFPGSRRAEIRAHMPAMLEIISEIKGRFPRSSFVVAAPSAEKAWQLRGILKNHGGQAEIRVDVSDAVIRWSDLVVTKSGTATVQIARHARPMVAMFAVPWWQWQFARHFITTRWLVMVNILAGRELVPEFIPYHGRSLPIARECIELLSNAELRSAMVKGLGEVAAQLMPQGGLMAAERAALEVEKLLQKPV